MRRLRRIVRDFFLVNPGLKGLSVAIALVLYVLVQREGVREAVVLVPVTIKDLPRDEVIVTDTPNALRVRVRARWSRVARLLGGKPAPVEVSVREAHDGEVRIDVDRIARALGVAPRTIVSVVPSSFELRTDKLAQVELPVRPRFTGSPARGFYLDNEAVQVVPSRIKVEGPASRLRKLAEIPTESIDVTGLRGPLRTSVQLRAPDVPALQVTPRRVEVLVPIREEQLERKLENVPVVVNNCSPLMRCIVEPSSVTLVVKGPAGRVEAFGKLGVQRLVQVNAFQQSQRPGHYPGVSVEVAPMPDLEIRVQPSTVTLRVERVSPSQPAPRLPSRILEQGPEGDGASADGLHSRRRPPAGTTRPTPPPTRSNKGRAP